MHAFILHILVFRYSPSLIYYCSLLIGERTHVFAFVSKILPQSGLLFKILRKIPIHHYFMGDNKVYFYIIPSLLLAYP